MDENSIVSYFEGEFLSDISFLSLSFSDELVISAIEPIQVCYSIGIEYRHNYFIIYMKQTQKWLS